ncbi:MAG TPA: hypothetical protein VGN20_05415 [Mucilaginibacter sp.]|jgi:hypothetical protein
MILKALSLFVATIGLVAIVLITFFIIEFVLAYSSESTVTGKQSPYASIIIYSVLAAIHIIFNVFYISRKSELPSLYQRISTAFVASVYLIVFLVMLDV